MLLTKVGSEYQLTCDYHERIKAAQALFRYDGYRKIWYTTEDVRALEFFAYADDAAKEALQGYYDNIQASNAVTSEYRVSCPPDKQYYPYQLAGIEYCVRHDTVLLADDMGIGKTIQAIGVINKLKPAKTLIVCPSSLKLNWLAELRQWLTIEKSCELLDNGSPLTSNIVIASYEMVTKNYDALSEIPWSLLVCDEAHYLKNDKAQRTRAIFGHKEHKDKDPITGEIITVPEKVGLADNAYKALFLTGSPILNRPRELWPLVHYCDLFPSKSYYEKRYCNGRVSRYGHYEAKGAANMEELQKILRSRIMIRRTKEQVLSDLPDKTRQIIELESSYREKIKFDIEEEIDFDNLGELLKKYSIQFSDIAKMRADLGKAKVKSAIPWLEEQLDAIEHMIVFCHHVGVGQAIADHFNAPLIHGGTSNNTRAEIIKEYQDGKYQILVGTTGAMGVGVTLTQASHCVFLEAEWSPLINIQAEDRLLRIGQKNAVLCQYLVIPETLDNLLIRAFITKHAIIEQALNIKKIHIEEIHGKVEAKAVQVTQPIQASYVIKPSAPIPLISNVSNELPKEQYSADVKEAVGYCLRLLDGNNPDHATSRNGVGFNKFDSRFGHNLANISTLTDKQVNAAIKMLKKYSRTQLPKDKVRIIWSN